MRSSKRGKQWPAEPVTPQTSTDTCEFREIKTELLLEPLNPARETFDEIRLRELVESIRLAGILQPLCVSPEAEGTYRVHAGHRRLVAARALALERVPCMVYPADAQLGEAIKHHENRMREELNCAEEARHFSRLLETVCGGDVDRLCALVMEQRQYVEARLILLRGDEKVFQALADGVISIGVAQELNKVLEPARRLMYLDAAMQGGASVRMVRDWRIKGNQTDQIYRPSDNIVLNHEDPLHRVEPVFDARCYICESATDTHEMEILYVHRSCARAMQRIIAKNTTAAEGSE